MATPNLPDSSTQQSLTGAGALYSVPQDRSGLPDPAFFPPPGDLTSADDPFPLLTLSSGHIPFQQPPPDLDLSYNLANLGKDGDLNMIGRQINILMAEINSLMEETDAVFGGIDAMFFPQAQPMATAERFTKLIDRFDKLGNTMRITGLGGLSTDNAVDYSDVSSLIESKQAEVQASYRERRKQREGAGIVLGVLEAMPADASQAKSSA